MAVLTCAPSYAYGAAEVLLSLIDDNIRSVVREQTNTGQDGQLALCEAQKAISTLYEHIIDVKTRAERTEEVVKDITRDIKQLDCAKRNLISAITTLNHLHMLVGGIESLKILIEKCLYDEILNLLQAITEVNQHFQQSSDIEEIKNLSQSVDKIQISLTHQITEDLQEASSVKTVIHVWILISCFSDDLNNSNNNNNLSNINLPSPYAVMPVSSASSAMVFTDQIINNQQQQQNHHLRQPFYSNTNLSDRRHNFISSKFRHI
ncbi:hypothetical protein GQX74_009259 [Glossina fuscipes]|nr:hypothetical protein GQX74_009259 [Glossina fuscipes]